MLKNVYENQLFLSALVRGSQMPKMRPVPIQSHELGSVPNVVRRHFSELGFLCIVYLARPTTVKFLKFNRRTVLALVSSSIHYFSFFCLGSPVNKNCHRVLFLNIIMILLHFIQQLMLSSD